MLKSKLERASLATIALVMLASCAAMVPRTGGPGAAQDIPLGVRQPTAATPLAPAAAPATAPTTANARAATLLPGPSIASLPLTPAAADRARAAFVTSCAGVQKRTDQSGLTRPADWVPACAAARGGSNARRFFAEQFETAQVADGKAFATGYYEPEIAGSRTRRAGYEAAIYRRPPDLIEVDLGLFNDELKGKRVRGRIAGQRFLPYWERREIVAGALANRGLELGWAADPVELFFLQVQGSGRLRLPDGSVMRIGYDSQNGRGYTGIGKLMRDRGLVGPGQTSMQGLMAWLRANPVEGAAIMNENKSWVFFRELTGAGPIGSMGVPVVSQATVATDPAFVPLGAPVFLSMDRQDANGLWVAQDTGGAIKGSNRFDTFWGAGAEARAIAGGMAARGTSWVLLPKGTLARLRAEGARVGAAARP